MCKSSKLDKDSEKKQKSKLFHGDSVRCHEENPSRKLLDKYTKPKK